MIALGLHLSEEEIRVALGLRLGTTLCEPHLCHCGERVDARGLHGLACRKNSDRQQRHNMLNDIVWRSLRRANVPSTKEPLSLTREDGKRPDGVTLILWSSGRCLACRDVTVLDTFSTVLLAITSNGAGEASNRANVAKRSKYATNTRTCVFVAVALESSGAWSSEGLDFVLQLGWRLTDTTLDKLETSYLFKRFSVAIQRGNVICLSSTLPF